MILLLQLVPSPLCSYLTNFPLDGETPICDSHRLYTKIQEELPELARNFETKGIITAFVTVIRFSDSKLGLKYTRVIQSKENMDQQNQYQRSWQDVFEVHISLLLVSPFLLTITLF